MSHRKTNGTTIPMAALLIASGVSAQNEVIFEDNFDGPLDTNIWQPMLGDGSAYGIPGWGNNELQSYTSQNAWTENGRLIIEARNQNGQYTSARLRTINQVDVRYGTIEASIRLPSTKGIWPAFWMLPTGSPYGGWPRSGEIDIMESVNSADRIFGTIHFGDPKGDAGGQFANGTDFSQGFHVYRIDWSPDNIRWYVDGQLFRSVNSNQWYSSSDPDNPLAPFDQSFHMLLNVAVGGNFPGNPDHTSVFPQRMEVDWVRVTGEGQSAYAPGGNPIPGQVEAEDFDNGAPSLAYNDLSPGNVLGAYRTDVDVDIEPCSEGGFNIGEIEPTDWVEYTIDVDSAGTYDVEARVASQNTGGRFRLEIDGQDISGTISTPVTGGWQNWQTVTFQVDLPEGESVLRFQNIGFPQERYNLNWFRFTQVEPDCLADVNQDGSLTPTDFGAWLSAYNAGDPLADQDLNGFVTPTDFGAWLANYNAGCQ